jgi:hypothetical protein
MRLSAEHPDLGRRDAPRHGEPVSALLRPRRYWNARTCVLRLVDDGLDCPRPTCLQRLVLRGASQRGDRASSVSPSRDPRAASRRASPPLYGLRRHLSALRHGLRSSRPDEEVIRDHGWELAAEEPGGAHRRGREVRRRLRELPPHAHVRGLLRRHSQTTAFRAQPSSSAIARSCSKEREVASATERGHSVPRPPS